MRRRDYTIGIALSIAIVGIVLQGCAETVVGYGVGKVILAKDRSPVYVTEDTNVIADCKLIKHVHDSTKWGGLILQDEALEHVIAHLTDQAAAAGGNVLLIRAKSKGFTGSSASGAVYSCPNYPAPPATPTAPPPAPIAPTPPQTPSEPPPSPTDNKGVGK